MSKDLQNVLEVIDGLKESNSENAQALKNSLLDISAKLEDIAEGSEFIFVRNTLADFKEAVSEKFERITNELENLNNSTQENLNQESPEILVEKFKSVSSIFESGMNLITTKLDDVENTFEKSSKTNFENLKNELSKISNELSVNQQEIIETQKTLDDNTVERFSFVAESIKMLSENMSIQTKIYKECVEEKIDEISTLFDSQDEKLKENSKLLEDDLDKKFSEIENANTGLSNALSACANSIKEILDNLENTPDKTAEILGREFKLISNSAQDSLTEIKVLQDYSVNMTKILKNVEEFTKNNKVDGIKEAVKELDIATHIKNLFGKIDIFNNNFNIKTGFLEEQIAQLKAMFSDVATELQMKDAEMLAKQSERIKEYYSKVDEVTASLMNLEQNLKLSGVEYKESIADLNKELTDFIKEFNSLYSEMSGAVQVEITQSLDDLKQFININSNNYNDRLMIIQEQFTHAFRDLYEALKTNRFDLIESGLNNQSGLDETSLKLINSISARVDILAETDYTDDFDELYAQSNQTQELIRILHSKVDELLNPDNDANNSLLRSISSRVDELTKSAETQDGQYEFNHEIIKLINEIDAKIDVLATVDYSEDLDEIAQNVSENTNIINELNAKLDILAMGDDNEEIHEELKEIKDIIREQQTAQALGEFPSVQNSSNIKELMSKLDNIAKTLAENEEKNYIDNSSYTLVDVENDIAKLRQVLNKISEATPAVEINQISQNIYGLTSSIEAISKNLTPAEIYQLKQNILKLNDDILSISSRTNKLLLSSDESQKTISDGVLAFSHIAYDLQEKIDELSNKEFNAEVATKLEKMQMMLENSASMNSTFHKVLMFLGEWVDAVSDTFENINSKADEIAEVSEALSALRKVVPEKIELINLLEEKFEEQQERMDRLEAKINDIVEMAKLNNNVSILQKVDNMEKLINTLNANVEKLTSFVD